MNSGDTQQFIYGWPYFIDVYNYPLDFSKFDNNITLDMYDVVADALLASIKH